MYDYKKKNSMSHQQGRLGCVTNFHAQKVCWKCIFVQTEKKLNLWGKTAVDKIAWIKAWL